MSSKQDFFYINYLFDSEVQIFLNLSSLHPYQQYNTLRLTFNTQKIYNFILNRHRTMNSNFIIGRLKIILVINIKTSKHGNITKN